MTERENSFLSLRELFEKDRVRFTDQIEKELSKVRKKEDLERALELLSVLKKEIQEISPLIAASVHPVLIMMIKNHYCKQIAEHAGLFETCANVAVCRLLDELVTKKKEIRFLAPVEIYRIRRLALTLAGKFRENDIVYRLELELQKEDMEWRDNVE